MTEARKLMTAFCMSHFDQPKAPAFEFLPVSQPLAIGHQFDDANGDAWTVTWCAPSKGGWLAMVSQC